MKSRREGFIFSAIGIIFLIVNITVEEYIFKTHLVIDIMPDFIGCLFMMAGCMLLGKSTKMFRAASLFSIAGVLLSVLTIWQFDSNSIAALIQALIGIVYIGLFWCYLSGIRKAAERAGEAKLAGQSASLGWLLLILRAGTIVFNYMFLMKDTSDQGILIASGVVVFGVALTAAEIFTVFISFNSFRKLGKTLAVMRKENICE